MQAYTRGRDVLMAFEEDISIALAKACEQDNNQDAMHNTHAALIVHRHILYLVRPNHLMAFPKKCQKDSVPKLLLTLVNMVLDGPSMKDQKQHLLQHSRLLSCSNSTVLSTSEHQTAVFSDTILHRDTTSIIQRTDAACPLPTHIIGNL